MMAMFPAVFSLMLHFRSQQVCDSISSDHPDKGESYKCMLSDDFLSRYLWFFPGRHGRQERKVAVTRFGFGLAIMFFLGCAICFSMVLYVFSRQTRKRYPPPFIPTFYWEECSVFTSFCFCCFVSLYLPVSASLIFCFDQDQSLSLSILSNLSRTSPTCSPLWNCQFVIHLGARKTMGGMCERELADDIASGQTQSNFWAGD